MKVCSKCKKLKELDNFGYRPQGKLKKQSACNQCYREIRAERMKDQSFRKRESENASKWAKRNGYKHTTDQAKKYYQTKRERYPEKYIARSLSNTRNKVKGFDRHHWSYNIEHVKDVIELLKNDHKKLHRYIVYDRSTFMYKRRDNMELLNTKEKHLLFIEEIKYLP